MQLIIGTDLKNVFKEPPPKDIVHLSMPKDEGGVNVVGVISSQEKGKNSLLVFKKSIQEAQQYFPLYNIALAPQAWQYELYPQGPCKQPSVVGAHL